MKTGKFALDETFYDILKTFTTIWLPAISTLYFTLGGIWNWPNVEQVIGTISAIGLFLAAILKISSASYNNSMKQIDGRLTVEHDPSENSLALKNLKIDTDANVMARKKKITLEVHNEPPAPQ